MLYMAPTYPLIRDIWYPKLESFLTKLQLKHHIDKKEHTVQVGSYGKIFCRTMEKPARVIGFEVLDAYLDELDILSTEKGLEIWRKAKARCRQKMKKVNQTCITTTPEGYKATYELFKKSPIANSQLIQMTTYSNKENLPEGYIEELLANYTPELVKAYIDGEFTNLTFGSVYPFYNRIKNRSILTPKQFSELHIGVDFNIGQMSAIVHGIFNDKPHTVAELSGILDTPAMIRAIRDKFPKKSIVVYPDSAGNSRNTTGAGVTDIKLLKAAGFRVVVDKTNPMIRDRVNSVNAMFLNANGVRRYFVNDTLCPEYASDLEQQAYDKNGLPDKSAGRDHKPDAGGYFINKRYGINIKRIRTEAGSLAH